MVVEITLIVVGIILLVLGLIGCIAPVLPGPVLSFLALIVISIPSGFSLYSPVLLIILGAAAIISQLLDNLFPVIASKKAGAGKTGIWGSVIGMILGMIFFPPLGVIIGAFLGALGGEMIFNREKKAPFKAAMGVFTGTLLGIIVKLTVSGIIATFFITKIGLILS